MRVIWIILLLVAVAAVAVAVRVRTAPVRAAQWDVDPATAADPAERGAALRPVDSPVWSESPAQVLGALDRIAKDTARTQVVTGSVAEGRITYVTRTALWGFPDFTTVSAVSGTEGTRIAMLARLRYGQADMGVNGRRVEAWLAELRAALPPIAP